MNYSEIKYCDIANGEGVRTSLFVSGCRRACPFCFNSAAWDFNAGRIFDEHVADNIIDSLAPSYVDGLSVLGGEPFEPENQYGLVEFLERVKRTYPDKTIWCYSGYTYDQILEGEQHTEVSDRILQTLDILVDGPFVNDLKDISLRFRGSSNQRIIDVPKSLAAGAPVLWEDDPVFTTHTM